MKLININVFLRETQNLITKCPSLLSNSHSARQKQQPTTETPSPQAGQRARLGKAGWFTASEVEARAWQAFRRKRKHGSHPWPFHRALGWWPASWGNKQDAGNPHVSILAYLFTNRIFWLLSLILILTDRKGLFQVATDSRIRTRSSSSLEVRASLKQMVTLKCTHQGDR